MDKKGVWFLLMSAMVSGVLHSLPKGKVLPLIMVLALLTTQVEAGLVPIQEKCYTNQTVLPYRGIDEARLPLSVTHFELFPPHSFVNLKTISHTTVG